MKKKEVEKIKSVKVYINKAGDLDFVINFKDKTQCIGPTIGPVYEFIEDKQLSFRMTLESINGHSKECENTNKEYIILDYKINFQI